MGPEDRRRFVFMTGATGMVGSLILADLLRASVPVAVLIRDGRGNGDSAAERLRRLMNRLESRFSCFMLRPVMITGNLNEDRLGISDADRDWIARNCSSVVHSAACLSFRPAAEHQLNEPFRTNIDGLRNLIRFTNEVGIREWHYVSTAFVAGTRTGRVLETEIDQGQEFSNDYERSKLQAEQILSRCRDIDSLTVYRPSIVIDSSALGGMSASFTIKGAYSTFETLCRLFGLPENGAWFRQLGMNGSETKNIVDAQWVAQIVGAIMRRPPLHGRTYHLTNPKATTIAEIEAGFLEAFKETGVRGASDLMPRTLVEEIASPYISAFAPYFRSDPSFDQTNLSRALREVGISQCPGIGVSAIRELVRLPKPAGSEAGQHRADTDKTPACEMSALSLPRFMSQKQREPVIYSLQSSGELPIPVLTESLGLMITGAGGGQWVVRCRETEIRIECESASSAVIALRTSTDLWCQLLRRTRRLGELLESGQALIECNRSEDLPLTVRNAGLSRAELNPDSARDSVEVFVELLQSLSLFDC